MIRPIIKNSIAAFLKPPVVSIYNLILASGGKSFLYSTIASQSLIILSPNCLVSSKLFPQGIFFIISENKGVISLSK